MGLHPRLQQLTQRGFPWIERLGTPFAVVRARRRRDERVLDAASGPAVRAAHPAIVRVVRHDAARMRMPDPAARDPVGVDRGGRCGVEHRAAAVGRFVQARCVEFGAIADLEQQVRMIERDTERRAGLLDMPRDACNPREILAPHVDVHFEARQAAGRFAPCIGAQVEIGDFAIRQRMAVRVMREQLTVEHRAAEPRARRDDLGDMRFVAARAPDAADHANRQRVALDQREIRRQVLAAHRILFDVVEHAGGGDHPEALGGRGRRQPVVFEHAVEIHADEDRFSHRLLSVVVRGWLSMYGRAARAA